MSRIQNLHGSFTSIVVDEAKEARVLQEIWFNQSSVIEVELSEDLRCVLANDYAFGYADPLREYSVNDVSRCLGIRPSPPSPRFIRYNKQVSQELCFFQVAIKTLQFMYTEVI
jgi:hypothetical protein